MADINQNLNDLTNTLPTQTPTQTPTPNQPQDQEKGTLANLTVALRSALDEAAKVKSESRIRELSGQGLMPLGASPNAITAAIGLATAGFRQTQADKFSDALNTYNREQDRADAKRQSAFNMLNTIWDNGILGETPDEAIMAFEKEARVSPGTFLAYKAQALINKKQDDIKREKDDKLLDQKIKNEMANSVITTITTSNTGANYNTRLNQEISNIYSGRYGTEGAREQAIKILQDEFPKVDASKDIYNRVPNNWEKNTTAGDSEDLSAGNSADLSTIVAELNKPFWQKWLGL